MLTLLAQYGPDSWFGWLMLLFVANLPLLVASAIVVVLIIRIALAALASYRPSELAEGEFGVPSDPEGTASYLRDRAQNKRERSRIDSASGEL